MKRPPVTLCLIARDEDDVLGRCLGSVEPYVEEMVVVDTGSADDTPSLAASFGARVVHKAWTDDFSEARNAALALARSRWILVLDADEWIEGSVSPEALADRLESTDAEALTVEIADRLDGGGNRRYPLVRLFRNRPEHRYEGAFHEQVTPSIARRLGTDLVPDLPSGLVAGHDGYLASRRKRHGKESRNLSFLRKRVRQSPGDRAARYFLARERVPLRGGRAVPGAHLAEALEHLDRLAAEPAGLSPALEADAVRLHAAALLASGDVAGASALLDGRGDDGVACTLLRADVALRLPTEPDRLRDALERVRDCFGHETRGAGPFSEPALSGPVARARAAELLLAIGEVDPARHLAQEGTSMPGGGAACWNALAAVERGAGHRANAVKAYIQGLKADDMDPFAWAGLGEVVFDLGDVAGAAAPLKNAATLAPGWDAVDEAFVTACLIGGRESELCSLFSQREPDQLGAGGRAGLILCGVLDGKVPEEPVNPAVAASLGRILQRLAESGGAEVLERLAEARRLLE